MSSTMNEPHVSFLQAVLESIRDGAIQIPRFQRPLVWSKDQMTKLLDSVRNGLPIGAIMVWRTHLREIACRNEIAPGYLVKEPPSAEGALRQYLLDGQQRMVTLYQALVPISQETVQLEDSDALPPMQAYLDLESDEFIWLDENPGDFCMPLDIIFDSIRFLRFTRKIPDKYLSRLDRIDQVAKAFREYKIATIPIVGDDLAIATQTFQRVNSEGTKMSTRHMIHALTWSPTFDLFGQLDELKREFLADVGWSEIDDDRILDACAIAFGLHALDRDVATLSKQIKNRSEILAEVVPAIRAAAQFFADRCFIPSPDLVPFKEQLVLIAEALRINATPSEHVLKTLESWLWLSTYTELFGGSSVYKRMTLATSDIRSMAKDGNARWSYDRHVSERRELPPGIDFRTGRGKAFAIRLAAHAHAYRTNDDPQALLASFGTHAIRRVVAGVEQHLHGSPGNCFVVREQDQGRLYRELRSSPTSPHTKALCMEHIVEPEAQRLLIARQHDAFIKQRRRDLDRWEQAFVNQCRERFQ